MLIKKLFLLFFTFLFLSFMAKRQDNTDFLQLINKATSKIYQNPQESISFIQNQILSDKNPEHQIILQYISAQASAMKGDYVTALKSSIEKDFFNTDHLSEFSRKLLDLSLAEQYQNLGLYHQSRKILAKIQESSIHSTNQAPLEQIYQKKLLQLKARNAMVLNDFDKAMKYIKEAKDLVSNKSSTDQFSKFENTSIEIQILILQNKLAEAKQEAEIYLRNQFLKNEFPYLFANISLQTARIYFLEKDYQQAKRYLDEAALKIENLGYLGIEKNMYNALSKTELALDHMDSFRSLQTVFNTKESRLSSNKNDGIRYITQLVENRNQMQLNYLKTSQNKKILIYTIVLACMILFLSVYFLKQFYDQKSLKKQISFLKYLEGHYQPIETKSPVVIPAERDVSENLSLQDGANNHKRKTTLSKEKEDELLEKLEDLELSNRFMDKNMSLGSLAGQLDTNTKYLSEIINLHKGKNFNSYINELRVNKIAYLLKTKPEYRTYKISYLAEVSGFSSHSNFATIFKTVTGVSPNVFIAQISKPIEA